MNNNVPPGYKQTDVGVIPEDWELRPLLTAVRVASGQVDPRVEPYRSMVLVAPDHIESGSGRLLKRETACDQRAISGKYLFAAGDVVYSKIRPYLRKAILADCEGVCSADMYPLRPIAGVSSGFILSALLGHHFSKYAESVSVRSGMPKINRSELAEYMIALPPTKSEQEAIAGALSDADALIESLEQLIAKKRHLKQGAMQELLTGKKRLPGFSGKERKKTEIGDLPSDWQVLDIGQIATVKTGPFGSTLHERDYVSDGTPIVTVEHLGERGIMHTNLPMVSDADCKRLNAYGLEDGDIVFSRVGSVDRNARVTAAEVGWLFSGRLLRLRAVPAIVDTQYLSYQFHSEPFKQRVRTVAVGQTMASLNTGILKGVLIALPPLPEQTAIAAILIDMDTEIAALEAKLTKARQLKQGMMQELLTGRIRLV